MDNEADCKKAVEEIKRDVPFANFKKTEVDDNWPKGCYLYIKTGGVYFNTDSDGSRHNDARQICKSKGKSYYCHLTSIHLSFIRNKMEIWFPCIHFILKAAS